MKKGDFIYLKDNVIKERHAIGVYGCTNLLLNNLDKKYLIVSILPDGNLIIINEILESNVVISYKSVITVNEMRILKIKQILE